MKKLFLLISVVGLCLALLSGCKNGAVKNTDDGTEGYTSIEQNVIGETEARYLLESEYDGSDLEDGETYRFTYQSTERSGDRNYLVFKREAVDPDGTVTRTFEDSWVAEDGSYVTDKNTLARNQNDKYYTE